MALQIHAKSRVSAPLSSLFFLSRFLKYLNHRRSMISPTSKRLELSAVELRLKKDARKRLAREEFIYLSAPANSPLSRTAFHAHI